MTNNEDKYSYNKYNAERWTVNATKEVVYYDMYIYKSKNR